MEDDQLSKQYINGTSTPSTRLEPRSRPNSAKSDVSYDGSKIDLNKNDPLPPIGSDWNATRPTQSACLSSMKSSNRMTSGSSFQSSTSGRPRIVSYRRETNSPEPSESEQTSLGTVTPAVRVVSTVMRPDGREQVVVSVDCQTEWSWMADMQTSAGLHRQVQMRSRKSQTRSAGGVSSVSTSASGRKSLRTASPISIQADIRDRAFSELNATPHPSRADEYGIPLMYLSSESDASGDEGDDSKGAKKTTGDTEVTSNTLPSIGPPQILQYPAESKKAPLSHDVAHDSSHDQVAQSPDLMQMFAGSICEFCQKEVKSMPTLEEQQTLPLETLFCCESYREMMLMLMNPAAMLEDEASKQIDIKPHPPYGSKHARKVAKEMAAQKMRERELERQQMAMAAGHGNQNSGGPASFYQFARQMKTINYMLSSQRCLDEGWTLRPPSPLFTEELPPDVFEPEHMLPPWADVGKKAQLNVIMKYYENGNLFLILFTDGTGNVFYPNGQVAITINSVEQGIYTYIVQEVTEGKIVAVCETSGYITVYHHTGGIRLCLDQLGGVELDVAGGRKKRWSWHAHEEHVHAPPIQPITLAIARHLALRVISQQQVTLTFSAGSRACRFQVGAKLKLIAPEYLPEAEFDEHDIYRREITLKVAGLFDKVSNLLKFPNSPKCFNLPYPAHVNSGIEKLERDKDIRRSKDEKKQHTVVVT